MMILSEITISEDINFELQSPTRRKFFDKTCKKPKGIRLLHISRCIYPRVKLVGYFPTPHRVVRWIPSCRVRRKGEKVVRVWEGLRQILAPGWPVTRAVTHRPRCTCLGAIILLYWFISRELREGCMNFDSETYRNSNPWPSGTHTWAWGTLLIQRRERSWILIKLNKILYY